MYVDMAACTVLFSVRPSSYLPVWNNVLSICAIQIPVLILVNTPRRFNSQGAHDNVSFLKEIAIVI